MEDIAKSLFERKFGNSEGQDDIGTKRNRTSSTIGVAAPGRVNLIGEHTDYNEGFVMPLALEKRTAAVASMNEYATSSRCRIVSALNESDVVEFTLDDTSDSLKAGADSSWASYVKGVIKQYFAELVEKAGIPSGEKGQAVRGFDAAFASDVPLGGGLSSSASLEVCTAILLETLYGISTVNKCDRALRCVEAEHTFANVPCGIMDQFISSCATPGCALLIDCRSKETEAVDLNDDSIRIVVTNSNVKHKLSGSEFPTRVAQCKEACKIIQAELSSEQSIPVDGESSGKVRTHLRDVTMEELEAVNAKGKLDEVIYRRARHGISEDVRTLAAVKHAQNKEYAELGKLMVQSHNSLRDDYEVSTPEIDFIVEHATQQPGVFGARITGGGFGGCVVSLVRTEDVEAFITSLEAAYVAKFSTPCTSFSTKCGHGAHTLWAA
eukprot:CAMPEP_0184507674 /NCGR_PEP_ID=MMETSP0198_2-20121128/362_1 /TAXON_ID=1112570 /ORGANISM="Thraustochytrium sp., Strain LLF1b" /LENGTH=437 /DNA_ID=CAMNT_0026897425 /DNA_START=271 /DNA_END=1580 /DNA_ORIENTATION=+